MYKKLIEIQKTLKAPKNQTNSFGGYKYRSCEDILEAVKPILAEQELLLTLSDEVVQMGDKSYVKATAAITDGKMVFSASAFAREPLTQKGMSDSQLTGTASSYARKYALNGLFLIDDTKDPDTDEFKGKEAVKEQRENKKMIEEVSAMTISTAKMAVITNKATEIGVTMEQILKKFNLKSIGQMTEAQFAECIKMLEKQAEAKK